MDFKKQLDDSELIKLLEETPELAQKVKEDPVLKFINYYNILPGNDKIKVDYLFMIFKNFVKTSMNLSTFKKSLGVHRSVRNEFISMDLENSHIKDLLNSSIIPETFRPTAHISLITDFILDCEVMSGSDLKLGSETLHNLFKTYLKRLKKRNVVPFETFEECISDQINNVITKHGMVLLLKDSIMNHFNEKELEEAKDGKNEKNKKKSRKISKSET